MKRLGALVGVVAMVAAALFVRGTLADDATDPDDQSGGSGLLCPSELATVCTRAVPDVASARAGETADALIEATSADDLDQEAWVVPAAWARLVLAERARLGRDPLFEIEEGVIASSVVMLAIWADRAEALQGLCGSEAGWRCLAEQSGSTVLGNPVRAGAPDVESASGLTVSASQAAELLGRSDFAANDFDGDFRTLVARLAAYQRDDPLVAMRARGPGELTAAGVLTADGRSRTSAFGTIAASRPDPIVRADVVALVRSGASISPTTRAALTDAFIEVGWDAPSGGPDGLPGGGVLAAIRTLWNDSR